MVLHKPWGQWMGTSIQWDLTYLENGGRGSVLLGRVDGEATVLSEEAHLGDRLRQVVAALLLALHVAVEALHALELALVDLVPIFVSYNKGYTVTI